MSNLGSIDNIAKNGDKRNLSKEEKKDGCLFYTLLHVC
jgi:hypothetical protein